jgi:hypothetical protein
MESITIAEVLRGTKPGRMQSVGYMQVIPLISDLVDERFTSPNEIASSTRNYGTLNLHNEATEGMGLMPFGGAIVTPQQAQNHATPKAKLVEASRSASIDVAACIQDSQGGTIARGKHPLSIMPWSIKEKAFDSKEVKEYSKLWPAIKGFNTRLGLRSAGHLELYLKDFKDQLDEFVAQFEIVPKQVGAIVLVNGYVVGVERAPNYNYWKDLWKPLVRECYGSLSLEWKRSHADNPPAPRTRIPVQTRARSIKGIRKALAETEKMEWEVVLETLRKFVGEDFDRDKEEEQGGFTVESLKHKQFVGQIVRESEKIVYASLITTGDWYKNREWNEADEFKI